MHATANQGPKLGDNGSDRGKSADSPGQDRIERELADALRAARSVGAEALTLARLELAKLRASGRRGLRWALVGLWLGVALLAATWTAAVLAVRGLAAGLNDLFDSVWIGDVLAPSLLFGALGGALLWRWRLVDERRARELRERFEKPDRDRESASSATPAGRPGTTARGTA